MVKEKFVLSDKKRVQEYYEGKRFYSYSDVDVKEFIRLLKENMKIIGTPTEGFVHEKVIKFNIDTLAGKELI